MTSKHDVSNLQASNAQNEMLARFFRAASDGDVGTIRRTSGLFNSVDIDERNSNGWSALMLASRNGHKETVDHLLNSRADSTLMNKSGQTARQIASFWNHDTVVASIDKFLSPKSKTRLEHVNYFGTNSADRQSYRRKDVEYVESLKCQKSTKYIVFSDLQLFTSNDNRRPSIRFLSYEQVKDILTDANHDIIYIGNGCVTGNDTTIETSNTTYFAVNFKDLDDEKFPVESLKGEFIGKGYAPTLMLLPKEEAGMVAQARSVLAWHDRYRFCPTCGTETNIAESGYKRICGDADCRSHQGVHNTCFPRIDPVAIVLVISPDGKKCLLGRQRRFPPRMYSCLAGFMEPGESIEDAARREVFEESGVRVGRLEYHSSQPWPFPSQLMIGLIGQAITDDIEVDQVELEDAKWFTKVEVAEALAAGFKRSEGLIVPPKRAIAHQLQKSWVQMSSNL